MRLLAICWTAGWVVAAIYMAARKGRSMPRAALEALLLRPFVLLIFNFAKQAKKTVTGTIKWPIGTIMWPPALYR